MAERIVEVEWLGLFIEEAKRIRDWVPPPARTVGIWKDGKVTELARKR